MKEEVKRERERETSMLTASSRNTEAFFYSHWKISRRRRKKSFWKVFCPIFCVPQEEFYLLNRLPYESLTVTTTKGEELVRTRKRRRRGKEYYDERTLNSYPRSTTPLMGKGMKTEFFFSSSSSSSCFFLFCPFQMCNFMDALLSLFHVECRM